MTANDTIKRAIADLREARKKRLEITADDVLQQLGIPKRWARRGYG
jgi:hypothetical protein